MSTPTAEDAKNVAALARMISYMNDDTYMFRWDNRTDIPDHVLDDYADIHGEDDLLVSIKERSEERKMLEGSDDGSSHSSGSSDADDAYMTGSKVRSCSQQKGLSPATSAQRLLNVKVLC